MKTVMRAASVAVFTMMTCLTMNGDLHGHTKFSDG